MFEKKPDPPPPGAIEAETKALAAELAAPAPGAPGAAAQPGAAPAQPAAPPIDWAGDAKVIIDFAMASFTPFFPSLATVYTPEARAQLDPALGNVFKKYDFDLARLFAKWEPEIRLSMVVVPLLGPTIVAVRTDWQARKDAREKAEAEKKQKAATPPT